MRTSHLIVTLFLLISLRSNATHIVGGEIFYDYLGSNNYQITLKLYRDCSAGTAAYDDPASIFVFNSAGVLVDSLIIPFPGAIQVPPTINNPCYSAPGFVCVEEADYQSTIHLPPIAGGYDIGYSRCCRNGTIMNITSPGNVGATYSTHIPDPSLATGNSCARYNNFPPIYLCEGVPLFFDHSATDPNGDSLYYDLCDANIGLSVSCPLAGAPAVSSGCPYAIPPPPYAAVPWVAPYNGAYPMSASPAMAIDHHTGLLTGTPNMIGQWVVAVCVSEYRNGHLLNVNKRDFQFNVTNCPVVATSVIPSQTTFCFGYNVNFDQACVNAFSYHWDFGDPSTTADTSNIANPTWVYADSGTYVVTLTINMGTPCQAVGTTTFYIYPLLAPSFAPPPGQCEYTNSYSFTAGGAFMGNGTFSWTFTGGTPSSSLQQNPMGIVYGAAGTYPVSLTVSENGCTQSYSDSIHVYPRPVANYGRASDTACAAQPVYFIDSSQGATPFTYQWIYGDGSTGIGYNPSHTYPTGGSYSTSMILTDINGCKDTFALPATVVVYPAPSADFIVTPKDTSIFYPRVTMIDRSFGGISCKVNWGDNNTWYSNCDSAHHTYASPGIYLVTQVVMNIYGCYDTAYYTVLIRPEYIIWIPNAFTPFNGDNLNTTFKPVLLGVHDYNFMIFDRWGELIFETNDTTKGWDGLLNGNPCQEGVYVYKITFGDDVHQEAHKFIGGVTLVK